MQFISILALALLVIHQASASPIPEAKAFTPGTPRVLSKRANPTAVKCGLNPGNQQVWSLEVVQNAFAALQYYGILPKSRRPAAGTRFYPQQLGNGARPPEDPSVVAALDAIPECATSLAGNWKWFEFPLTDPTFDTGPPQSQGADRVVAISRNIGQGGTRSFTYCLAVTHRDEVVPGGFDPCATNTNVNVQEEN